MTFIIICGYGPTGRSCVEKLERETANIVVVDKNPEKLKNLTHAYVIGDAAREEILKKAGIERADILIATAGSDVRNAFITLAAKSIKPSISVLAPAERIESVDKLYKAGADFVVPESSLGARELVDGALSYIKESSRVYLGNGMELHGIKVKKAGRISDMEKISGAVVVGVRKGNALLSPKKPEGNFSPGDILYVLGTERQTSLVKRVV